MGLRKELADVESGMEIMPRSRNSARCPSSLSEADPEGCAACSARLSAERLSQRDPVPQLHGGELRAFQTGRPPHANIAGMLTWAFEFEDQPYFDGFRTLATNGIDKPVLNLFRMAGLMRGDRVKVESSGAAGARWTAAGVRGCRMWMRLATRARSRDRRAGVELSR